jgi:hypothetical protein
MTSKVCFSSSLRLVLLFATLYSVVAGVAFGSEPSPFEVPPSPAIAPWAESGRCGANCLYALLKLRGIPVEYEELVDLVAINGALGSSLEDLQNAAAKYGVELDARKVKPEELGSLPTPFILHVDSLTGSGAGHFLTVTLILSRSDVENLNLRYLDGGNGILAYQKLKDLRPSLSLILLSVGVRAIVFLR